MSPKICQACGSIIAHPASDKHVCEMCEDLGRTGFFPVKRTDDSELERLYCLFHHHNVVVGSSRNGQKACSGDSGFPSRASYSIGYADSFYDLTHAPPKPPVWVQQGRKPVAKPLGASWLAPALHFPADMVRACGGHGDCPKRSTAK